MEINEYQKRAMDTCMPSCSNISYMLLNLVAEVGEFSGKVAKTIRKSDAHVQDNDLIVQAHAHKELRAELRKEAGDILWQISGLCTIMGWALEDVAKENLEKLASRQKRGKIEGNGDNR